MRVSRAEYIQLTMESFRGQAQVTLIRRQPDLPHVGGKSRDHGTQIYSFLAPRTEPMDHERISEVMHSRGLRNICRTETAILRMR